VGACLVFVGRSRGSEPLFDEMKSRLRGRNRRGISAAAVERGVMYPDNFIAVQSAFNAPFYAHVASLSMTCGYARTTGSRSAGRRCPDLETSELKDAAKRQRFLISISLKLY